MKRLAPNLSIILICICVAPFFTSCDSEKEIVEPPVAERILGKWKVFYAQDYSCADPADNYTQDLTESDCYMEGPLQLCVDYTFTYNNDNTLVSRFQGIAIQDGVADTSILQMTLDYFVSGDSVVACSQTSPENCKVWYVSFPSTDQLYMRGEDLGPIEDCIRELRLERE